MIESLEETLYHDRYVQFVAGQKKIDSLTALIKTGETFVSQESGDIYDATVLKAAKGAHFGVWTELGKPHILQPKVSA